jgi:hypothetical protein
MDTDPMPTGSEFGRCCSVDDDDDDSVVDTDADMRATLQMVDDEVGAVAVGRWLPAAAAS